EPLEEHAAARVLRIRRARDTDADVRSVIELDRFARSGRRPRAQDDAVLPVGGDSEVLVVACRAAQAGCADDPSDLVEPARQRGKLDRLAFELELAAADNVLATLERRTVQLDGAELAAPLVDLRLGAAEGRPPPVGVCRA